MNDHKITKTQRKGLERYQSWIIGLVLLSIVSGLVWYNKTLIMLYYAEFKYQPYKQGEKIYLKSIVVNDTIYKSFILHLHKRIRPLNEVDVDNMTAQLWQKALIKQKLSKANKPYIDENAWGISIDSLCKYKTACIGTYEGSEIQYIKYKGKYYRKIFLIIKPNKQALYKDLDDIYKSPNTYTDDDESPYYLSSSDFRFLDNEESKTFRKIN